MVGHKIPTRPEELTPEWLTDALRETGAIRKATVTSVDVKPDIAAGVGFMGVLARVSPQYDQQEDGAPDSFIAKFPSPVPENREIADTFRLYERETRFYQEIAGEVELRTPRCYYGDCDPQSGDFVLLLEDLPPACVGDQLAGCSAGEAELALRELAKFHATWWNSPQLDEIDWMPLINDPLIAQSAQDSYLEAWDPFVEYAGDKLPASVREVGEEFGKNVIKMMDRFGKPPRTIVHGDYRLDNLFFGLPDVGLPDEGDNSLAVIDWQISSRGPGVFDVAYFLCGTMAPAERKASEMDLLRMYHGTLVKNGVHGYDFEQCFEDYRASALFCLLYSVLEIGNMDTANERGVELFDTIMKRAASAISDLNAGELLPSQTP